MSIRLVSVDASVFAFNVVAAVQNLAAVNVAAQAGGSFSAGAINGVAVGDILKAEGFANAANNGFFKVVAVDGTTGVTVTSAGGAAAGLVSEPAEAPQQLSLVQGGSGISELGFDLDEAASSTGTGVVYASNDLRRSVGRFGSDLSYQVRIDGGSLTTVDLPAVDGPTTFVGVDLSSNNSIFDLAADINRALRNAGLQLPLDADRQIPVDSQVRVEAVGDRLLFIGGNGVSTFSVTAGSDASDALGLTNGTEESNQDDLVIQLHGRQPHHRDPRRFNNRRGRDREDRDQDRGFGQPRRGGDL